MKKLHRIPVFLVALVLVLSLSISCVKAEQEVSVEEPVIEGSTEEAVVKEEPAAEEVTEETFEEETTIQEDKKIFKVGDIINFGDLEFSVNGITAEEGSEDINLFIEVSIKNNGDVDRKISSYTMFELLDEFQRKQIYSLSGSKNDIDNAVIPPGETLTGEISFIVPEDVKEFDLKVGLNLSTEEVEFLNNMLKQFLAGEDISAADIKRAEELENREHVMVKIFLE